MEKEFKVLIVEDHPTFRKALIRLIKRTGFTFKTFGEAGNEEEAINLFKPGQWDLIVLDISLRDSPDGFSVLKKLGKIGELPPVVICSGFEYYEDDAKALGVIGYIDKYSNVDEIKAAFQTVLQGGTYFSSEHVKKRNNNSNYNSNARLSQREIQVLRLLALGYPNKRVAEKLQIAKSTVEFHRKRLRRKTKCGGIGDLTRYAFENGYMLN